MTMQLIRFLMVGGCGFASDVATFLLARHFGGGPVESRLLSASVAVTVTWYLNRRYVFGASTRGGIAMEYLRYLGVQAVGQGSSLGCYFTLIFTSAYFAEHPLLALWAGGGFAVVVNYLGARFLAFRTTAAAD